MVHLQALAASTLAVGLIGIAWPLACWLFPRDRASLRWAATAVLIPWLLVTLFWPLAAAGLFRISVALPIILGLALAIWWWMARPRGHASLLRADLVQLATLAARLRRDPIALALLPLLVLAGVQVLRGLLAPPLAWDALTYHMVKAGRWVQVGGWVTEQAPDAWTYYDHFPPAGDILWAWAMLPTHDDRFVVLAGLATWLLIPLGAYAAATQLGAGRRSALLTALGLAAVPAALGTIASTYVHNAIAGTFCVAVVFLLRLLRDGRRSDGLMLAASLGLLAGLQLSNLPLVAAAMLPLVWSTLRAQGWARGLRTGLWAALAAAAPAVSYGHTWVRTGNPLYPLGLSGPPGGTLAGNPLLRATLDGSLLSRETLALPLSRFVAELFLPVVTPQADYLNLGLGAVVLGGLGLAGAGALLRRGGHRGFVGWVLLLCLAGGASLATSSAVAHRTIWAAESGRFLLPSLAGLALLGVAWRHPQADRLRAVAVLAGCGLAIPGGISSADLQAWACWGAVALPCAALALLLSWIALRWSGPRWLHAISALVLTIGLLAPVAGTRAAWRHAIWRATDPLSAQGSVAYDGHVLRPLIADSWTIWHRLDGSTPLIIAYTTGWDGLGHNWMRYPLMGHRLQNRVVYVPPTASGRPLHCRWLEPGPQPLDPQAWAQRLLDQQVDVVVTGHPAPVELSWVRAQPASFSPIGGGGWTEARAWRVDREALARDLNASLHLQPSTAE